MVSRPAVEMMLIIHLHISLILAQLSYLSQLLNITNI